MKFVIRFVLLSVFAVQSLCISGMTSYAHAESKGNASVIETAHGSVIVPEGSIVEDRQFAPNKIRGIFSEYLSRPVGTTSDRLRMGARPVAFMAVVGALAVAKCIADLKNNPNCDELWQFAEAIPFYAASLYIFAKATNSVGLLAAARRGYIQQALISSLGISVGMYLAQVGTDAIAGAMTCIKGWRESDNDKSQKLNEACNQAFENFLSREAVKTVPTIVALVVTQQVLTGGVTLASRAAAWEFRGLTLGRGAVGSLLRGAVGVTIGGSLLVTAVQLAAMYAVYNVVASYVTQPWERATLAYLPAERYFDTILGFGLDRHRKAYGFVRTEKEQSAGDTISEVEASIVDDIFPKWVMNGYKYLRLDPNNCQSGSFGGKVCEWPVNLIKAITQYGEMQKKWRDLALKDTLQIYSMWRRKFDAFMQLHNDAITLYGITLAEISKQKALNKPITLPPQFGGVLQMGLSAELENADPFIAPPVGFAEMPTRLEFIIASMACGPWVNYDGRKKSSYSSLLHDPNILKGPYNFLPPALVKEVDSRICDMPPISRTDDGSNVFTGVWVDKDKKQYHGLLEYVAAHVDENLLPKYDPQKDTQESGAFTAFGQWWYDHVTEVLEPMWKHYQLSYQKMLRENFFPALYRVDYEYCTQWGIDNVRQLVTSTFPPLNPKTIFCQDNGKRILNGSNIRTRLPRGVFDSIREEIKLYLQMLEAIYLSLQDPKFRVDGDKAFRENEAILLKGLTNMHNEFPGDILFGADAILSQKALLNISLLYGMNLEQAEWYTTLDPETLDREEKIDEDRSRLNRFYIAGHLIIKIGKLIEEEGMYRLVNDGVGAMERPDKKFAEPADYQTVPQTWTQSILSGIVRHLPNTKLPWVPHQQLPEAK